MCVLSTENEYQEMIKAENKKMSKTDTLDALDNAMTTILTTNLDN